MNEILNLNKEEIYVLLARSLANEYLDTCVLRGHEKFPQLAGFDMDLLTSKHALEKVRTTIEEVAKKNRWKIWISQKRGHLYSLIIQRAGGKVLEEENSLQIDLHTSLTILTIPYAETNQVLKRKVTVNGAAFAHPVDSATLTLLEKILARAFVKEEYKSIYQDALYKDPAQVGHLLCMALGKKESDIFALSEKKFLIFSAAFQALRLRPMTWLTVLALKTATGLRNILRPSGKAISLSGPDGAGKSTVISLLASHGPRRICFGVTVYHTRPYIIPRLASLLSKRKAAELISTRTYEKNLSFTKSWSRAVLLLLDYNVGYWLKVRPKLARGELVIFDRYFLDFRTDPRIRGLNLSDRSLQFIEKLIPSLDLNVVLIAPPEILAARKDELSVEEAKLQIDRYRQLAMERKNSLILDSEKSTPEELAESVARRTFTNMERD